MSSNIKIAVTGASGFIGANYVRLLERLGYVVSGSDHPGAPKRSEGAVVTSVDINDADATTRWLGAVKPDVVVHLGARTDLLGRSSADYNANTAGVSNIIKAVMAAGSVRRVVFASSRMVCRIDHVPVSYADYCPPNLYGESKVEGERIVKTAVVPFEWTIVRPTSIWGPGFGIPYRNFFDQVRRKRYFHQRGRDPRKSFGYIGNTVHQLEKLIQAPRALVDRRTFYLGDYEPLNIREWANYIHARFELPGTIPTVPMSLLRVVAKAGDFMNFVMRKDAAPLTTFRLNNLVTDMVYPQLSELESVTGPLPYSWRKGTEETVDWLRSTGPAANK